MREIRLSGSEGGVAPNTPSLPLSGTFLGELRRTLPAVRPVLKGYKSGGGAEMRPEPGDDAASPGDHPPRLRPVAPTGSRLYRGLAIR